MQDDQSKVWFADCHVNQKNILGLQMEGRELPDLREYLSRCRRKAPLEPSLLPHCFSLTERSKPLVDFGLVSRETHIVSERFARIARAFDLGAPEDLGDGHRRVEFYPREIRESEHGPKVADTLMLYVATVKDSIIPERCSGIKVINGFVLIRHTAPYPSLVLDDSCLDGPDLWQEVKVDNAYFFSDRLKTALVEGGVKGITFTPCTIVSA